MTPLAVPPTASRSAPQVFDPYGKFKAQWRSRVGALAPSRQPWLRHVSSISYQPRLDAFAVVRQPESKQRLASAVWGRVGGLHQLVLSSGGA